MKHVFTLLTLLVLAGLLVAALGIDRQLIALAQDEQPPVLPVPPVPEGQPAAQVTAPDGGYNLPAGDQVAGGTIQAAVNRQMSYQGRLLIDGQPCQGLVDIIFRLWTVETLGTAVWSETQTVTCDNGLFSVMLGKVTPLPLAQVFYSQLWLGVKPVGAAAKLKPRQLLGTVPYAMNLHGGATMSDVNPAGGYGTSFYVYSANHPAIFGQTVYTDAVGVTGVASGAYSGASVPTGVYGSSSTGYGVHGVGNYIGVYGQGNVGVEGAGNDAYDIGVYGYTGSYSHTVGVEGVTYGDYSYGMYAYATGLNSPGVYAITYGADDGCGIGNSFCNAAVAGYTGSSAYGNFSSVGSAGRNAYIGFNNSPGFYAGYLYNQYHGWARPGSQRRHLHHRRPDRHRR